MSGTGVGIAPSRGWREPDIGNGGLDTFEGERPAGWLTTVTSRLALDRLRAQRRRREVYVGPWLPDLVPTARNAEETAELAESLTLGFLVLPRLARPGRAPGVPLWSPGS